MKILYIPARKLRDTRDGGDVETRKMLYALRRIAASDPDVELTVLSDDLPEVSRHLHSPTVCRMFGHSLPFYFAWRRLRKKYLSAGYDVVVLGISRLGHVAADFKKWSGKTGRPVRVIAQFHNIEAKYIEVNAMRFQGLNRDLFRFVEERVIARDEGAMIANMDTAVFLTRRDQRLCQETYGYDGDSVILPICVEKKDLNLMLPKKDRLNLVFFGSLKFSPNQEGVKWFLRYVWKDIQHYEGLRLVIAGSEPPEEFISEMRAHRDVVIHRDYERIEPLLHRNSLFISPILTGAGMKTKVADALSLGIPVVGTRESMEGYEESIEENAEALRQADTPEEFITRIIEVYHGYSQEDFDAISREAEILWERYYSMDRAYHSISSIVFNN